MYSAVRDKHVFQHQQARYVGLGTPDTTRDEWLSNVFRDTYSSYVGHRPRLMALSVAYGKPMSRLRHEFLDAIVCPPIHSLDEKIPRPFPPEAQ